MAQGCNGPITLRRWLIYCCRVKEQKRQKKQEARLKIIESRKQLQSVRVVQKNLVYVIGLPPRIADEVRLLPPKAICGHLGVVPMTVAGDCAAAFHNGWHAEHASKVGLLWQIWQDY